MNMTPEELHAWDMYFAGVADAKYMYDTEVEKDPITGLSIGSYKISEKNIKQMALLADAMLIERRKRYENT